MIRWREDFVWHHLCDLVLEDLLIGVDPGAHANVQKRRHPESLDNRDCNLPVVVHGSVAKVSQSHLIGVVQDYQTKQCDWKQDRQSRTE